MLLYFSWSKKSEKLAEFTQVQQHLEVRMSEEEQMSADVVTSTGISRRRPMSRPSLENFFPWIIVFCLAYSAADLLIIKYRHLMLPTEAPPPRPRQFSPSNMIDSSAYRQIIDKNIFAADGKIPPPLVSKDQGTDNNGEEIPQPSNLPLNLVGTLVHSKAEKSIATIEVKSKNQTVALSVGKEIEGIAKLEKVERNRAIIRNLNNRRLEYIEMKQNGKISFSGPVKPTGPTAAAKSDVKVVGQNRFEISRADVLKHTADMASLLQQAAMQPRRNAQGEIECYKFIAIQPQSIFTQLGFQPGDCLKAVQGEKIDSPAKAMELYNALKNSASIDLLMERDGRDQQNNYNINK